MLLLVPLGAALVALSKPPQVYHKKHRHSVHARIHSRGQTSPEVAQRRIARLTLLALMAQREALLRDFIITARTESPVFKDDRTYRLAPGVEVSATAVAVDFLGSPIIRANVKNASTKPLALVLTASVIDVSGIHHQASTTVTVQPGQNQFVELLCPSKLSPASVIWSSAPL